MTDKKKVKKYFVKIEPDECKGCERCVNACPKAVLKMGTELNFMGFPFAYYVGAGCVGCSACFYNCPEPGAVTIFEVSDDADGDSEKEEDEED